MNTIEKNIRKSLPGSLKFETMAAFKFSGHESFACRHYWVKKGVDFVADYVGTDNPFRSQDATIKLGVGKNMVKSIEHWLKAFQLTDESTGNLTDLAQLLIADKNGEAYDPYLESDHTPWILHYNLMSNEVRGSIYKLIFQKFRTSRTDPEFTAKSIAAYIQRQVDLRNETHSSKSIKTDINVFLKSYSTSSISTNKKSLEDDLSTIFNSLELIQPLEMQVAEKVYKINFNSQQSLNSYILLYGILDKFGSEGSIAFDDIQSEVSNLFLCNREGTESKLRELDVQGLLVYKQDSGRKEIQLKSDLSSSDVISQLFEGAYV